jgi:peptide/nickel transport system permease protein
MLGVVVLMFAVLQLIPARQRATLYAQGPKDLLPGNYEHIIEQYGLNAPVYEQFITYMNQILHGNFGYSEFFGESVISGFLKRLPATIEIVIFSAPIIIFFGIWLGTAAAVHRDKVPDHLSRVLSILGTSLPSFFFGYLLIAAFIALFGFTGFGRVTYQAGIDVAASQGLFRQYTGLMTLDSLLNGNFPLFIDALRHLIMPVMVLVLIQSAVMVRVTRSSMLEALGKTYIVAARAKGLSRKEVIYKHARRNALIPVVTISGMLVGGMLTGLVITETVFRFQGVGNYAAQAAVHFDVSVVAAFAMFSALVFVIANLLVDVLYGYIDPRIRLG